MPSPMPESVAELPEAPPPVEFVGNYNPAQIYHNGFEFAFMSWLENRYLQICTFVYCKDFLHDLVWSFLNQSPVQIWGFRYDPKKNSPPDLNHTVLAFRDTRYKGKEAEFHQQRVACLDLLHQIENKLGFDPSRIYEVPHPEAPAWLIIGDKRWQLAPALLGFYTINIRLGFSHTLGQPFLETFAAAEQGKINVGNGAEKTAGHNDGTYLRQAKKGIEVILRHGAQIFLPEIEKNYPKEMKGLGMHDNFGPVNFTRAYQDKTPVYQAFKDSWYREEFWKE